METIQDCADLLESDLRSRENPKNVRPFTDEYHPSIIILERILSFNHFSLTLQCGSHQPRAATMPLEKREIRKMCTCVGYNLGR